MRLKDTHCSFNSPNQMTATLELPINLTIAALRKAGTGDNLLAVLDALVVVNDNTDENVAEAPVEFVNMANVNEDVMTEDMTVDLMETV